MSVWAKGVHTAFNINIYNIHNTHQFSWKWKKSGVKRNSGLWAIGITSSVFILWFNVHTAQTMQTDWNVAQARKIREENKKRKLETKYSFLINKHCNTKQRIWANKKTHAQTYKLYRQKCSGNDWYISVCFFHSLKWGAFCECWLYVENLVRMNGKRQIEINKNNPIRQRQPL